MINLNTVLISSKPKREIKLSDLCSPETIKDSRSKALDTLIHSDRKPKVEDIDPQYERKLKRFDSQLSKIHNPELADYLILCKTDLFGKIDPEEIPLMKEYKARFGNIKQYMEA
jgi:hypothetical protein